MIGSAEDLAVRRTVAYARVSSHDQKDDLERQKQVLELYCARQGWTFEVIANLGFGMNDHKKGLKRLLNAIMGGQIGRLVITHKDRLLRIAASWSTRRRCVADKSWWRIASLRAARRVRIVGTQSKPCPSRFDIGPVLDVARSMTATQMLRSI